MPAFTERVQRALRELGYTVSGQGTSATDPVTGQTVSENSAVTFQRGGGAVSIIDDTAIAADIRLRAGTTATVQQGVRPYYATLPVCATRPPDGSSDCARSAVTSVFDYTGLDATARTPFARPIGVTIAPIVAITSPRFGDHVSNDTSIRLTCACSTVIPIYVQIFSIDSTTGQVSETPLTSEFSLTQDDNHSTSATFGLLSAELGQFRNRYRVVAIARTGAGTELSRGFIDVTLVR
jgi:hypothetical protein